MEDLTDYAIFMMNPEGEITTWNQGVERILGYPESEFVGRNVDMIFTPEDVAIREAEKERQRAIRDGRSPDERWHLRKSGERFWVDGIVTALRSESGELVGFSKIMRDATTRKIAETEVVKLKEQFADLVESIAEAFLAVDRNWTLIYCNQRATQLAGRPLPTGTKLWELFPDVVGTDVYRRCHEAMDRRSPVNFEAQWGERWYEVHLQPTSDGLSAYILDTTERRRLEQKVREAAKLESVGVMAGGIAHDFNNLLTGILGGASLLADRIDPESDLHGVVDTVVQAAERAAQLTRQMLAYSGRGRFFVQPVDLGKLVSDIVPLMLPTVSKNVELLLELAPSLPMVEADTAQMQQLVMNLVINGAEAIGSSAGTVRVSTECITIKPGPVDECFLDCDPEPGDYVVLGVEDNGSGMDAETKARIFDPFFTTKFTGRGLGLSAVRGIVRGHKGALALYTEPGRGTTFRVYLPVGKRSEDPAAVAETVSSRPAKALVLVVDDELIVRRIAKSALEQEGYTVLLARDGAEAIEVLRERGNEIGLIILDTTMPVMNGEQVYREIREISSSVPVLATSGYAEEESRNRFGPGIAGFLQKPYSIRELLDLVAEALARKP